jgi:hypothetical protein
MKTDSPRAPILCPFDIAHSGTGRNSRNLREPQIGLRRRGKSQRVGRSYLPSRHAISPCSRFSSQAIISVGPRTSYRVSEPLLRITNICCAIPNTSVSISRHAFGFSACVVCCARSRCRRVPTRDIAATAAAPRIGVGASALVSASTSGPGTAIAANAFLSRCARMRAIAGSRRFWGFHGARNGRARTAGADQCARPTIYALSACRSPWSESLEF